MKPLNKATGPDSWVIFQGMVRGEVAGPKGVCKQAEMEEMERVRPGSTWIIQSGIAEEGVAERLARGTSGDPKLKITRETVISSIK